MPTKTTKTQTLGETIGSHPTAGSRSARTGVAARAKTAQSASATTSKSVQAVTLALPEPEELAKYEKIIPGGAERILELAEQQSAHARELEDRQLETSAKLKLVKQVITFFLALGTGALGAALLLDGSELAGLLVIIIDAAALAAVSLYGKTSR